ncbi:MAG: VOC family protein [Pseudomonadales bacterium]|nr:VOC family protein [Pseudomonadales bacterium]MCP5329398.1 VOC family protein [Pseudomonadales bacterium]MCP5344688.1 VOC family protein [Pseudomonadales bacterium]
MRLLAMLCLLFMPLAVSHAQLAVPNAAGLRYGHVHLNVSDIELQKRLWVEHFGGTIAQKGSLTVVKMPNMAVILTEREPTGGSQETVMDHFGFKVRNIASFLAKWRAAGLPVGREFIGAEGQANAYVWMPDGVYVELQEDQALAIEIMPYHIHFFTPEHESLLGWYTELLDIEVRPRGSIGTTTNVPGMNLSFNSAREERLPTQGRAIDHIGFEVENLEAFCRTLEAKGIVFDMPYRDVPSIGLKIAFITDPSGVRIEFTEGLDDY